jgi:hypothetical protein
MNQRLVTGPIFKPQFIPWKWIAFNDEQGKDCFETHTQGQIIAAVVEHVTVDRHVAYAEIMQQGTWD